MFSGQGTQYYQMGQQLYLENTVFKTEMDRLDKMAQLFTGGRSIVAEIYNPSRKISHPFTELSYSHPAIFMTSFAMFKLLESKGIKPDYVLGSSLGEIAAAAVSGVINEKEALKIIITQARLIEKHCRNGAMLAVLHEEELYTTNSDVHAHSELAAINSITNFVLSGTNEGIFYIKGVLDMKDIVFQDIAVDYGFHSTLIDEAEIPFKATLNDCAINRPGIPVVSCSTAAVEESLTKYFFWDVVRAPIRFEDTVSLMEKRGEELVYIDLGPSGTLANLIRYITAEKSSSKAFAIMTPFKQEVKKMEELSMYHKEKCSQGEGKVISKPNGKKCLAFVFPGQGSQMKGMGKDLFDEFPEYTAKASTILGYSIKDLCLEDAERKLNKTQYTQPALYVVNALAYLKKRKENRIPDFVAGHSLGEYSALFAAGAYDFETGLRLVKKRGELMGQMNEGGMAAIKGLTGSQIKRVLKENGWGGLDMANYNTRGQTVISGDKNQINAAYEAFMEAGAELYFPLNVSGAFHSRYMAPARAEFEKYLAQFNYQPLKIPVVSNVEATFYKDSQVETLLARQLTSPVRWTDGIEFLLEQADIEIQEVGPGDVLTKMVWKIHKEWSEEVQPSLI